MREPRKQDEKGRRMETRRKWEGESETPKEEGEEKATTKQVNNTVCC